MDKTSPPDLDRLRELAAELAATDTSLAGQLACALAEAFADLSDRVDALWQLISAVVESAGLSAPATSPAGPASPAPASPAPAAFVQALTAARATGRRDVRMSVDGREWVAVLSQHPPVAEQEAWSAIERLARKSDQDER
jgi:hypothetical protein